VQDDELREGVRKWALLFLGIGVTAFVSFFMACSGFEGCGHHLTNKVRELLFSAIIRQEMAWFDEEGNGSGALCARLETDASLVKGEEKPCC
jgi:ATP-binding cassette subfamily B (MDR/TAP) protein 1